MLVWCSVFFQTFFLIIATREVPSFVQLCKRRDPELAQCFTDSVYKLLPYLAKGIRELNFPPIEPVRIESISVNSGDAKDLKLQAELANVMVVGLTGIDVQDFTIDLDNANFTSRMYFSNLQLTSEYKLTGKFLLFELNSAGHVAVNLTGVTINAHYLGSFYTKDGEQYLSIDTIIPKMTISSTSIHFDNLFPNNEELTETVNQVVNTNIDSLIDSLRPIIEATVGNLALKYHNFVFELHTVSQLFPDD